MVLFEEDLQKRYQMYSNIRTKVVREVKKGVLIPLKKGLYTDDPKAPPFVFGNAIYGPSYISFETALMIHGLISGKIDVVSSATRGKNKHKEFVNEIGRFLYQDVPADAFPKNNIFVEEGQYTFLIATKEKAVCDTLYKADSLLTLRELKHYLFDELGLLENDFWNLNLPLMLSLCPLYKARSLNTLEHLLEKRLGIIKRKKPVSKKASSRNKARNAWDALAAFRNKYGEN